MVTTHQLPMSSSSADPLQLPPSKPFRQFCTVENAWSDHYGGLHLAAAHAGQPLGLTYAINGIWHHGCHGPWMDFAPGLLCGNAPNAKNRPVFVARTDLAELLRSHEYRQVRVIGLPMVYTPRLPVQRRAGSLLVVPTHTLIGDRFPDRSVFETYAAEIAANTAHFARVVICVHPSCRKNGLWVDEFGRRGFEIVYGAQTNDANALLRMRALFEQFETVTTNGWGSHVAYALAFGARVSIFGSQPVRAREDFLRDSAWAADPQALQRALSGETAARERAFLAEFYRDPRDAVANTECGRWLIGVEHKLSPAEMKEILPLLVTPAVLSAGPTHDRHDKLRVQASELAKVGKSSEAVQLLLRYLQAVVESKQPRLILDTLTFVAKDLESLDPKKAALLREQAQKLSARIASAVGTAA
jgi:hypothetical protein